MTVMGLSIFEMLLPLREPHLEHRLGEANSKSREVSSTRLRTSRSNSLMLKCWPH